MAKDKMNIPQIRFKGFEGEWKKNKLGDICSHFQSGKGITAKDIYESDKYPVFGGNGLRGYTGTFTHEGTFALIGRQGALCGNIHVISGKNFISEHAVAVQADSNNDTIWLSYLLNLMDLGRLSESSAQPGLSVNKLVRLKIKLPIKNEQTEIGNFFQKIDQVIELQQKALDTAQAYKQSMLQKMFPQKGEKVPRVRFAGFSGEWEENRLKEVISSEFKGKAQLSKLKNGDVEYLDAERLNGGMPYLSNAELDVDYKDILILWDGSKAGTIYKGFQGALGSTLKAYKIMKKHSPEFIYQSLKYRQAEIFEKYRTPNIPHVIKDFTELFKIKLPSLEEQTQIGNFFQKLDQQIKQQAQKLATYQQLKKAMLQRMFV